MAAAGNEGAALSRPSTRPAPSSCAIPILLIVKILSIVKRSEEDPHRVLWGRLVTCGRLETRPGRPFRIPSCPT